MQNSPRLGRAEALFCALFPTLSAGPAKNMPVSPFSIPALSFLPGRAQAEVKPQSKPLVNRRFARSLERLILAGLGKGYERTVTASPASPSKTSYFHF